MTDWISLTYLVHPTHAQLFARILEEEGVSIQYDPPPGGTDATCSRILAVSLTGPLPKIIAAVERLETMTQTHASTPQPASDVLAASLPRQRSAESPGPAPA